MAFVYRYEDHLSFFSTVFLEFGSPESKVVPDELHDGGGVLVLVLLDLVDVSNGIVKGLLGELAGFGGVVLDFVVEHGVVQSEAQSDGVGGLQVLLGLLGGRLVGFVGVVAGLVVLSSGGVFGDVSVVVSLHFVVEDLSLGVGSLGDELAVDEVEDFVAVTVELSLNLGLVASEEADVLGALLLFLLLDGGEGAPGSSPGADGVLVGNGEEVAFLDGEVCVGGDDLVHGVEHVLKPLGLFGDLGHVEVLVPGAGSHSLKF